MGNADIKTTLLHRALFHLERREYWKRKCIERGKTYNDSAMWQFQDGSFSALYSIASTFFPDLLPQLNERMAEEVEKA